MRQQEGLHERYKLMSDNELVQLQQDGTLSARAYLEIAVEMFSREIPVQAKSIPAKR